MPNEIKPFVLLQTPLWFQLATNWRFNDCFSLQYSLTKDSWAQITLGCIHTSAIWAQTTRVWRVTCCTPQTMWGFSAVLESPSALMAETKLITPRPRVINQPFLPPGNPAISKCQSKKRVVHQSKWDESLVEKLISVSNGEGSCLFELPYTRFRQCTDITVCSESDNHIRSLPAFCSVWF